MYRNILVAIDGTRCSARALEHACELALALNAKLMIVSVVPPPPPFVPGGGVDPQTLASEMTAETERILREAADGSPRDLSLQTRLRRGQPAAEIVAQAEEGEHDLVVLGTRGRGRLASNLLGSVAGGVHYHLHTAMLVIHPSEQDES